MTRGGLAAAPSARRLAATGGGLAVVEVPIGRGFGASLGRVATSFAELLAVGEPTRLKVCANPDGGWVMYERSRHRSRRWCDATDCGNLLNVRHHRHRRRQANG